MGEGWRRCLRHSGFVAGAALVLVFAGLAIAGAWLRIGDPLATAPSRALLPPGAGHLFGTDAVGRDLAARVVAGARLSLLVGLLSRAVALLLGTGAGLLAGYFGGRVDGLLMRLADMTLAFPALLLLIAVVAAFGPSLPTLFLALGVLGWAPVARVLRSQVLSLRRQDFIEAARALGCRRRRILLRHLLPNLSGTLWVLFSMGMASAIIAEGSLSFLGLGAQPPQPSWGTLIRDGFGYLRSAPWLTLIPGLCMALAVLGFNLLGDALRDLLDPAGTASSRTGAAGSRP
ncbi:ABC transporter permease [bacterium]|nr:ABC transporter permease [bacterium]